MAATTRTVVLMRHGKSGYPEGTRDHDRPLSGRGHRGAALAGQWITANLGTIDAVICSTATRTRETLAATGVDAETRFDRRIYGGSTEEILEEISYTADSVTTLMVVGHAPGIPVTALHLAAESNPTLSAEIERKFPTSAIAVLTTSLPWADLRPGSASLTHFHIPR